MISLRNKNWSIDKISTVLFDKDGTFLNDHIYWGKLAENRIKEIIKYFNINENFFEQLCFEIGYNPNEYKLIKNGPVGIMSRDDVVKFMVDDLIKYNIKTNFETISDIFNKVHIEFLSNIKEYVHFLPYAEKFIKDLKLKGIKLAVVTSDTHKNTAEILKILKIENYFDLIIGKDNCTKDKATGEPAKLAIEKLQANPNETIVIGDALMDYNMAKNANLRCLLVTTGQTDKNVLEKCNKYVVDSLNEVIIHNAI